MQASVKTSPSAKTSGTGYTVVTTRSEESDINLLLQRAAAPTFALLTLLCLAPPTHAAPQRIPVDPHFYNYDSHAHFAVTQEPFSTPYATGTGFHALRITFPSPVVTPYPVNKTVTGFLFLPDTPGPHPVMLVEHEWLPTTLQTEFHMSASLAKAGIAAFLIIQPYSYNRRPMPRIEGVELLSGDVPQMIGALRQAILDARRALDWLGSRPDIDAGRMGVAGISLGGVIAPLIAGVDHRARLLVTIVGGADVSDIIYDSPITFGLHPALLYHGVTYDSLKRDMAPLEPANNLQGFDPNNALLFNGRYDVFVSPKQAHHLSEALGGARIVWTNTGHYGTVFAEKQIEDVGIQFLRSRFGMDSLPFHPPSTLPAPTIKIGLLAGGHEGISPAIAYQVINFDKAARFSLDGQLTLHGLAVAPSVSLDESNSLGFEFPLLHGRPRPRLFYFFHFTL
jgi:hypothetical protein